MTVKIKISWFYDWKEPKQLQWNKIKLFFMGHNWIWYHIFFYHKIFKYFNEYFQKFSVLSLQWNQTIKNQTFSHGIYSNPTSYFFYQKMLKYFKDFFRDFFIGHIQTRHHIFFFRKVLKYFNDFKHQRFAFWWLEWTQIMKMKQNQAFFMGHIPIWHHILFHWSQSAKIFQWFL